MQSPLPSLLATPQSLVILAKIPLFLNTRQASIFYLNKEYFINAPRDSTWPLKFICLPSPCDLGLYEIGTSTILNPALETRAVTSGSTPNLHWDLNTWSHKPPGHWNQKTAGALCEFLLGRIPNPRPG